ncbi:MAG: DUF2064 domain-containing protein [Bacteroidota bacterium]
MNSSTAILLFGRSAAAESRAKAFGRGTRVAEALLRRTERIVRRAGLPVYRSTEADQRGRSFGERLANALADVYARGYARVIVVGSDCSSIQTSHLRAAAQQLANGNNVLGPDQRGGAWLIGLHRDDFDAEQLAGLSWETEALFDQLTELLPRTTCLRALADVNSLGDLRRLWTIVRRYFGQLFTVIFTLLPAFAVAEVAFARAVVARLAGRGPPRFHRLKPVLQ